MGSFLKDNKFVCIALLIWLILSQWSLFALNRDFWFDESFSAQTVEKLRQLGPNAIEFSKYDVHPPVYYSFLYVWSFLRPGFFPEHIWLRELSVLFAAVFIVFVYIAMKKVFGKAGEISVMMLPLLTAVIHYGSEARMYIMLMALAAIVLAAIVYDLQGKWLPVALIGVALFPFIHYVAAGASFYFVLVYIIYKGKDVDWKRVGMLSFVAVLGVVMAFTMYAAPQAERIDRMWVPTTNATHWASSVFHNFYYVDERVEDPPSLMLSFLFIYVFFNLLLAYCVWVGAKWFFKKEMGDVRKRLMFAMGISTIGIFAGLMIMSNVGHITFFHARYFLVVGWMFVVMCLVALSQLMLRVRFLVLSMLVLGVVLVSWVMLFAYVKGVHLDISQLMKTVPCGNSTVKSVLHDTPFTALPFEMWDRENGCDWKNYVMTDMTEREARSAGFDAVPGNMILWNMSTPRGYFYYVTSEDLNSLNSSCERTLIARYSWKFDPASVWLAKCSD